MRSQHIFALAITACLIALPVQAAHHNQQSGSSATSEAPKFCRMFEPAHWDNQGFLVSCGKQAERAAASPRRCPMFNPPSWDNVGFTVPCEREAVVVAPPPKTCAMFTPSTWDNMGFRVPC